ncbi:hypothetical protein [Alicyclobacillus fodiniaquatilis]|uniref:Uncharacterized protein n=1 Tax=Alicyclobacillus fodiniaquatilis TaxID=1661150 RepID=A0ABW4JHD8_9BACL
MCGLVKDLLAEKLIDDFYEEHAQTKGEGHERQSDLKEQLKADLSEDKYALLLQWEARCVEMCGIELREFSDFVAKLMLTNIYGLCPSEESEASVI